jgi:hypothetical protein
MASLRKSRREETPESQVFGIDEALAKISTQLMTPTKDNIFTISDITPEEVFGIAILLSYAKKFGSSIIQNWVDDFLLLRVSRMRLGRRELLALGTGLRQESEKKRGSTVDLFAGLTK